MRKIWNLLTDHLRADFSWRLYVSLAAFLAILIAINYGLNVNRAMTGRFAGNPVLILCFLALYFVIYYTAAIAALSFANKRSLLSSPRFWAWSFTGIAIFAVNVGFPYNTQLVGLISDNPKLFIWLYKIVSNLGNFLVNALPLFILVFVLNERKERFGVNGINVDLSPYFQILLVVAPMIVIASFETGFKNYYPTYKSNNVAEAMGWPDFVPLLMYEIAYGMDFFNVEFMFRGFLVIGMSRLIGKEAILPMVCTYCVIHFGKPIGECISSIFGGYILGVVAFYTRNIWGGVIVHIGLAWMMELAAFLQKYDW
jgi:hypothetical protein